MKANLVFNRKINAEKIKVQNCDSEKDYVVVEFFLVLQDSDIPKCNDELPIPKDTVLFTVWNYKNPYIYYDDPYEIVGADNFIAESARKVLKELSDKSPESKIYLIGYLGTNPYSEGKKNEKGEWEDVEIRKPDKPAQIKKMLREVESNYVKSGIIASKIVKIEGGYQEGTRNIKVYFVPKGGEIPKPQPNYFPEKTK